MKSRLKIVPGIHSTWYGVTNSFFKEPRLSAIYNIDDELKLTAACGKYYQFANRILREDILSGSRDFWILSNGDNIPVWRAIHYIAGLNYENQKYLFSAEGFYKNMNGLSEYTLRFNPGRGGSGGGPGGGLGQGRPSGGLNMPNPVKLTWDNSDESYYMVVTENMETNPVEIFETNDTIDAPRRIFRNEPTQASQTEIAGMSFQYFGKHRLILFHLNADYAALYTNTGNTSQNLTNPITNVQNGLGIFTGINSDTLYLNVLKQ